MNLCLEIVKSEGGYFPQPISSTFLLMFQQQMKSHSSILGPEHHKHRDRNKIPDFYSAFPTEKYIT